ncbi:MAG: PAS domain-containing protein [Elusimicrobia bacterium]|nr:PAS domain-containing protein [Elusimicrobiota bacterium]
MSLFESSDYDTGAKAPSRLPAHIEAGSEFIGEFGRAAKVVSLYYPNHPTAMQTVRQAHTVLMRLFAAVAAERVTLSLAGDRWLCDDAPIAAGGLAHDSLRAVFQAHAIESLTFLSGVRPFELACLCELAGMLPSQLGRAGIQDFLTQRGVTHIKADIERYSKGPAAPAGTPAAPAPKPVSRPPAPAPAPKPLNAPPPAPAPAPKPVHVPPAPAPAPKPVNAPPPAPAPAPTPLAETRLQPPPVPPKPRDDKVIGASFNAMLRMLVESAVQDPGQRSHIYEDVADMVKESLDRQVSEATKTLAEEKALMVRQAARTERVLTSVADGKVIVDKDGKVLMMNPSAEQITGKRLADIAGKHITDGVKSGEHMVAIADDLGAPAGEGGAGVQVVADAAIGGAMRRSLALVEDDAGRLVGTYAALPEVAKFKEAQRMQEEFLSRVTHDLQSPLAAICSGLEILSEKVAGDGGPDAAEFIDICMRNSRQLSSMIREILDFSKLEAGKMPVHPAPVSAAALVKEAVENLQPWALSKKLRLTARSAAGDLAVLADHQRIVQVLNNLISNAVKSTPEGGAITVAAAAAADGRQAVFAVKDTGKGIPKENLAKIFDKFVQLDDQGERREGVGLGLCIVNDFVKLHGGTVWAESEPGQGSVFYFTLPLAPSAADPHAARAFPEAAGDARSPTSTAPQEAGGGQTVAPSLR